MLIINMVGGRYFLLLHVFLVLSILCLNPTVRANSRATNANMMMRCIDKEKQALLKFKEGLIDDDGHLSSWGIEEDKRDCCKWRGVQCNNRTGHVVVLDLHSNYSHPLRGKITPSLLALQHLNHLDLSCNDFGTHIPEFIGSLSNLRYLNLTDSGFFGAIPDQLGNLTKLISLDLGGSNHSLSVRNLQWLSDLSSLRHLDLSYTNLSKAIDWVQKIHELPFLTHLHLAWCKLPIIIRSLLPMTNSSKFLAVLDLSGNNLTSSSLLHWLFNFSWSFAEIDLSSNNLQGPIPYAFESLSSLAHLDLHENQFEGGIPKSFGNLSSLRSLDLSKNKLTEHLPNILKNLSGPVESSLEELILYRNKICGPLPDITKFSSLQSLSLWRNQLNEWSVSKSFGQFSSLVYLYLSLNQITGSLPDLTVFSSLRELHLYRNQLNGTLTKSIGQLSQLQYLDASYNSLHGVITEAHFSNLSNLKHLALPFNSLVLDFSPNWIPPFQLDSIRLASCQLGPHFPRWLETQKNYSELDISDAGILGTVPNWFWDLPPRLNYLNLSYNQLNGTVPDLSSMLLDFPVIDLSSNSLSGPMPLFPPNATLFHLSRNMFSGSISSLCMIVGEHMHSLDLSHNQLSGELPDCWMQMKELVILNLENNKFSGKIAGSLGFLSHVQTLHLRGNNFTGELPLSLKNCRELEILDLEENKLSGRIPEWIGTHLARLVVLSLRLNEFHGSIPSHMCHLNYIQILDLSRNNISGNIPKCINNFTAMVQRNGSIGTIGFTASIFQDGKYFNYVDNALVQWKGQLSVYRQTLGLVRSIDLSSNKLTGKVPLEISSLAELITLNLSRNNLTGNIIPKIGEMKMLECLDLSKNQLSGEIPAGLARLNFLSVLDLSNNNLSGPIPKGTQLQSFNASAYSGNHGLCGLPLPNECPRDGTSTTGRGKYNSTQEDGDRFITPGFYASMALGFTLGFVGVFGTLLLSHPWRHACFNFLDHLKVWFYVKTAVPTARLHRRLQS